MPFRSNKDRIEKVLPHRLQVASLMEANYVPVRYGRSLMTRRSKQQTPLHFELFNGWRSRTKASCVAGLLIGLLREEVSVGNLQREFFRIEVGTVAKNDDGELVIEESLDHRAETHGASRVPHALVSLIRGKKPAEAVGDGLAGVQIVVPWVFGPVRVGAIGEFHRNQGGLHFFFAEQSVVRDGRIPLREIFQIRVDA